MEIASEILSDITVHMKYAKYLPEQQRRENWVELCTRNRDMHICHTKEGFTFHEIHAVCW